MSQGIPEVTDILIVAPDDLLEAMNELINDTEATTIGEVIADAVYLYKRVIEGVKEGQICYMCDGDVPITQFEIQLSG